MLRRLERPVLALDLATRTGWAARDRTGVVTSGAHGFAGAPGARYLRFWGWLTTVADRMGLDRCGVIAYETPLTVGRGFRPGFGRELAAFVQALAHARQIEVRDVAPSALKKHATGWGGAKKPNMIAAAAHRWGIETEDDNEADALCLLGWAVDQEGKP